MFVLRYLMSHQDCRARRANPMGKDVEGVLAFIRVARLYTAMHE
jgi:hypothetical protein